MKPNWLALALSASTFSFSAFAEDLSKETEAYKAFVETQMDLLLIDTEKFASYLQDGELEKAKQLYPLARMYFERSEPIAESFGDLDPRIDARLADLTEEARATVASDEQAENDAMMVWTGFHKIEKILWEDNTTKGTEHVAEQLVNDVKELQVKVLTAEVTPELMITGAVDLLNEVSTTKITGEEDIYSKTDLFDFKANIEGAEKIFELFHAPLRDKDPELAADIEAQFNAVNDLLEKYNRAKDGGYDYMRYNELSESDIKALAEAVNKLGEPLSQMGIILE